MKFTDAPWLLSTNETDLMDGMNHHGWTVYHENFQIATVSPMNDDHGQATPTARSNANIIRLAPEMFVALEKIMEGFDNNMFVRSIENDAEPDWLIKFLPYLKALADAKDILTVKAKQ